MVAKGRGARLPALVAIALLAACGANPPSDDSDLVEPLVPDDGDDTELVEPLVPAGTDAAAGYRVVLTYTSRDDIGALSGGIAAIHEGWIEHEDRFEGEVQATGDGRWEGELAGRAEGRDHVSATAIGIGDYTCDSSWDAAQDVDLILTVIEDDDDLSRLVEDPEPGAVYASITLDSKGTVDYADAPDECDPSGGAAGGGDDLSDLVAPLGPTASEDWAPFGAYSCVHEGMCNLAVMLPPSGFGKVIERVDQSLPGYSAAEWVFELEALD